MTRQLLSSGAYTGLSFSLLGNVWRYLGKFGKLNSRKSHPLATATTVALSIAVQTLPTILLFSGSSNVAEAKGLGRYKHVLILSVDGLRSADVSDKRLQPYLPNLRSLARTGLTYTNAFTSSPSDSFPGTLAFITGASPKTTGIWYDDSYSPVLTAPGGTAATPPGTEVQYAENIDKNSNLLDGGGDFSTGSIDPDQLPLDCTSGTCQPVYPHSFLKVNTIFEVAKAAGLRTAFIDKHPAYELANGPSGQGLDDFYAPEQNALLARQGGQLVPVEGAPDGTVVVEGGTIVSSPTGVSGTSDYLLAEAYDDFRLNGILNQIAGKNSTGTTNPGVPAIFYMNFQAVNVGEKVADGGINADGTPNPPLISVLKHTDLALGRIITALKQHGLFDSTLIVVTAKHGQNPRLGVATLVQDSLVPNALTSAGIPVAQATEDDIALLWLQNPSQTQQAAQVLEGLKTSNPNIGVDTVFFGDSLEDRFGKINPERTPNLIVRLQLGRVLVGNVNSTVKRGEHGGIVEDDTHVALIVGSGGLPARLQGKVVNLEVDTTQIAVTTLEALGLNPEFLQGARLEGTRPLPLLSDRR